MKAVKLTLGGLSRVQYGTGGVVRLPDRGSEVSRGHIRRGNEPVRWISKAGGLTLPKARTVPERG